MVLVKLTLAQGFRICVRKLNKNKLAAIETAGLFFYCRITTGCAGGAEKALALRGTKKLLLM